MSVMKIIYIIACFQGILVGILLLKYSEKNRTAKQVLSLLSFLISLSLIVKLLVSEQLISQMMLTITDVFVFGYGPLLYFFIKYLFGNSNQIKPNLWKHTTLPIIYYVGVLFLTFNQITYDNQNLSADHTKILNQFFFIAELVLIISVTFYFIVSVKFIRDYINKEEQEFSFKQFPTFFYFVICFMGLAIFSWVIGFIFSQFDLKQYVILSYNTIWMSLAMLSLSLSYSFILNNEVITMELHESNSEPDQNLEVVNKQLVQALETEQYFLRPKLSKAELAQLLETNTTVLTKVINGTSS